MRVALEILRWIFFAMAIAGLGAVFMLAYCRSRFWAGHSRREEFDRPWSPSEMRAMEERSKAADESEDPL